MRILKDHASFCLVSCLYFALAGPPVLGAENDPDITLIRAAAQERDSILQSYKYVIVQKAHRTIEGSAALAKLIPPGRMINPNGNPEAIEQKKIERIIQKNAERTITHIYGPDSDELVNTITYVWNGNIGKSAETGANAGRVLGTKLKHSDYGIEEVWTQADEQSLSDIVSAAASTLHISKAGSEITVVASLDKETEARLTFDQLRHYVMSRQLILVHGQPRRSTEVKSFAQCRSGQIVVDYPASYQTTVFIQPGLASPSGEVPKAIPLIVADVQVVSMSIGDNYGPETFDLTFPPGATIFDEFSKTNIKPGPSSDLVKQQIDQQAKTLKLEKP